MGNIGRWRREGRAGSASVRTSDISSCHWCVPRLRTYQHSVRLVYPLMEASSKGLLRFRPSVAVLTVVNTCHSLASSFVWSWSVLTLESPLSNWPHNNSLEGGHLGTPYNCSFPYGVFTTGNFPAIGTLTVSWHHSPDWWSLRTRKSLTIYLEFLRSWMLSINLRQDSLWYLLEVVNCCGQRN